MQWLSAETGQGYRLLSEAEWEYVARTWTETARYWPEGQQCRYGNGADASVLTEYPDASDEPELAACSDGVVHTAPVGSFQANAFGLHDVPGNVWEWIAGRVAFVPRTAARGRRRAATTTSGSGSPGPWAGPMQCARLRLGGTTWVKGPEAGDAGFP